MEKIAVIGCGLIGQGWATIFAQSGYDVAIYDASPEAAAKAMATMEPRLSDLAEYDLIKSSEIPNILARISVAASIEAALDDAIYVQESGPEDINIKTKITRELDTLAAGNVPIGSSTSGISASRYCNDIYGRSRCLVVHPINPPHLHAAVEIVPTQWTDKNVVKRVDNLMQKCGRQTILLNEEIDGFVVNRLQGALLEEAFKLVGSGVVSAEDLDKAICDGLGLRWAIMGPMQTIHLNAPGGVSDYVARYGKMYRGFGIGSYDEVDWASITKEKLATKMSQQIPVADISKAQVARDRRLMALLRHKKQVQVET
ncbi:MAG: 3-hydroxyacyl-CoA dehydrogenase [Rhizobiaceae bacterium]|nr:3-hydroxyacyl-CoA dehydrogenase [Rhizobiaceae bacterium]